MLEHKSTLLMRKDERRHVSLRFIIIKSGVSTPLVLQFEKKIINKGDKFRIQEQFLIKDAPYHVIKSR